MEGGMTTEKTKIIRDEGCTELQDRCLDQRGRELKD